MFYPIYLSLLFSLATCATHGPIESSNKTTVTQSDDLRNRTTQLPKIQMRILEGKSIWEDSASQHLVVSLKQGGHHICSGVYITAHIVLTASRCFDRWRGDLDELQVMQLLNDQEWNSTVDGVFRYPQVDAKRVDIALVMTQKMSSAWSHAGETMPEWQNRVDLPYPDEDAYYIPSKLLKVLGFGDNYSTDLRKEQRLAYLQFKREKCTALVGNFFKGKEICAPMNGFTRLCHGDEGGPAFFSDEKEEHNILIGIYSRSTTKCHDYDGRWRPGVAVFTRVSSVVPWILAKITRYTNERSQVDPNGKWADVKPDPRVRADESNDIVRTF